MSQNIDTKWPFLKRNRTHNWTEDEKLFLLNKVADNIHVVENKGNDALSVRQKVEVWTQIMTEYNQIFGVQRDLIRIKEQWKRMKIASKSEFRDMIHHQGESHTNNTEDAMQPSQLSVKVNDLLKQVKHQTPRLAIAWNESLNGNGFDDSVTIKTEKVDNYFSPNTDVEPEDKDSNSLTENGAHLQDHGDDKESSVQAPIYTGMEDGGSGSINGSACKKIKLETCQQDNTKTDKDSQNEKPRVAVTTANNYTDFLHRRSIPGHSANRPYLSTSRQASKQGYRSETGTGTQLSPTGSQLSYTDTGSQLSHNGTGTQVSHTGTGTQLSYSGTGSQISLNGTDTQMSRTGTGTRQSHSSTGSQMSHTSTGTQLFHNGTGTQMSHPGTGTKLSHTGIGTQLSHSGTSSQLSHTGTGSQSSHNATGTQSTSRKHATQSSFNNIAAPSKPTENKAIQNGPKRTRSTDYMDDTDGIDNDSNCTETLENRLLMDKIAYTKEKHAVKMKYLMEEHEQKMEQFRIERKIALAKLRLHKAQLQGVLLKDDTANEPIP